MATLKFEEILRTIQSSNLNFHLEISPFSATIQMKKSLVTNKLGISLFPPPAYSVLIEQEKSHNIVLSQKIEFLEHEISVLKSDHEQSSIGRDEALDRVTELENELKTVKADTLVKNEEMTSIAKKQTEQDLIIRAEMRKELNKLEEEKASLECILSKNVDHISDLNDEIKRLEAVSKSLNRELVKARAKSPSKSGEIKALKVEIKQWRRELGEERKQKIKLEKALAKQEAMVVESKKTQQSTVSTGSSDAFSMYTIAVGMSADSFLSSPPDEDCTICAEPIQNYKPDYFDGVEMNPACDNCKTPTLETQTSLKHLNNVPTDLHAINPVDETLVDINDNNETQDQHHHPEPRHEYIHNSTPSSAVTMSAATSSSRTSSTPSTSSSSAVTSSSRISIQERIQCSQCSRKCVDKRDMEHHFLLWHSEIMMSRPRWAKQ